MSHRLSLFETRKSRLAYLIRQGNAFEVLLACHIPEEYISRWINKVPDDFTMERKKWFLENILQPWIDAYNNYKQRPDIQEKFIKRIRLLWKRNEEIMWNDNNINTERPK